MQGPRVVSPPTMLTPNSSASATMPLYICSTKLNSKSEGRTSVTMAYLGAPPMAATSLMPRMPWLIMMGPVRLVLVPESLRIPGPDLVMPPVLVRLLAMVTPPAAVLFWWKIYSPEAVVMPLLKPLIVIG